MPSETDFHLFTSMRYDPLLLTSDENSKLTLNFVFPSPFYMLVYHRDRMLEAAQHFEFNAVADYLQDGKRLHDMLLQKVKEYVEQGGQDEALKLRILFDREANLSVDFSPVPPVPLSGLFPSTLDPPKPPSPPHPANQEAVKVSSSTGGALTLGATDSLPAGASGSFSGTDPSEFKIRLDKRPTPISPFTLLKTTYRDFYDESRKLLPKNPQAPMQAEVMLYNEVNEITEGTITSIYLYRGGRWVTPPVGVPAGLFTSDVLKDSDRQEDHRDEGELRKPFAGRWGHSVRSAKVGSGGQRGTTRRWALGKGFCMEEPVGIDTVTVGESVWVSSGVRGFRTARVVE